MRGNAVMRAKRTTGPSPNTVLLTRQRCETCSQCDEPSAYAFNSAHIAERYCREHGRSVQNAPQRANPRSVQDGWLPAWMRDLTA